MKVHLIASGEAGSAVIERLTPMLQASGDMTKTTTITPDTALDASLWPHADLRIVASWREDADLFEVVDRSAAETGTSYLPIVFEHPRLRIGPTIIPGSHGGRANTTGGCNQCFEARQRQHNAGIERANALWQHYRDNRGSGPAGYLPQHIGFAAALAGQIVADLRKQAIDPWRNQVHNLHLLNGTVQRDELIPVHGCQRCGITRSESTWADLADELVDLLPNNEGAAQYV